MRKYHYFLTVCALLFSSSLWALAPENQIQSYLQEMTAANNAHVHFLRKQNISAMLNKQTPRATVVMCSDSRVQNEALSTASTNDMFIIRNIGNQLDTAKGSVEYGVRHLHTPLLLIVGHSDCGAIKAGLSDFRRETRHIRAELITLETDPKQTLEENIVHNVNQQVTHAMRRFEDLIKTDQLVIIGAIYDMHNTFGKGNGRLILININNNTSPESIKADKHLVGLEGLTILY
ncbi:MAG: carbonic anhydrase [Gammaproteobacteria bacterium]